MTTGRRASAKRAAANKNNSPSYYSPTPPNSHSNDHAPARDRHPYPGQGHEEIDSYTNYPDRHRHPRHQDRHQEQDHHHHHHHQQDQPQYNQASSRRNGSAGASASAGRGPRGDGRGADHAQSRTPMASSSDDEPSWHTGDWAAPDKTIPVSPPFHIMSRNDEHYSDYSQSSYSGGDNDADQQQQQQQQPQQQQQQHNHHEIQVDTTRHPPRNQSRPRDGRRARTYNRSSSPARPRGRARGRGRGSNRGSRGSSRGSRQEDVDVDTQLQTNHSNSNHTQADKPLAQTQVQSNIVGRRMPPIQAEPLVEVLDGMEDDAEDEELMDDENENENGNGNGNGNEADDDEDDDGEDDDDDDDDDEEEEYARRQSEAAALQKTGWLLLTSSGRNLSSVLRHAGVTGLRVEQLYNLEVPPGSHVLAFVLLYKWVPDRGDRTAWNPERVRNPDAEPGGEDSNALVSFMEDDSSRVRRHDVLFCSQVMDNAAATQALMLALLNVPERSSPSTSNVSRPSLLGGGGGGGGNERDGQNNKGYDVGEKIRLLKAFLRPVDPVIRGACMCSSQAVRDAHNNAAREQLQGHAHLLDEDGKVRTAMLADELWMHSVYVPARGGSMVYELEGMSDGARVLAHCSPHKPMEWVPIVFEHIDERISTFRQHSAPFLLFALVSDHNPHQMHQHAARGSGGSSSGKAGGKYGQKQQQAASTGGRKRDRYNTNEYDHHPHHEFENAHQQQQHDQDGDGDGDGDRTAEAPVAEKKGAGERERDAKDEEQERISAVHNYETFFVEMLKLMASRGDINSLIRSTEEPSPPQPPRMRE